MSEPHKPVGAIFDAAIELPSERRADYLKEACGGDEALRHRVEALLRAHETAARFMAGPAFDPGRETPAVKPAEQPGDRIGRYKLLQQIGEGGCGVVYMAEQEEPVRRRVALKVIKLGMDTKSVIARFEAERQALALMDHPNIARVLDAGATETGRPYFVMELVRGVKITDYCDQNSLPTHERLDLFIQVCRAIQHAHQKGVIHRDIKPSNILVTMDDGAALPKVIDFGIAKATQGKLTDQTLFTAFEQFIGTPAYMSPEQAEMSAKDIDTRSDIYSLGVLLYELLTGETPFDAHELLRAGLDEIRRTIREKEPARPSTRLSTMLRADLAAIAQHRKVEPPKLVHLVRGDLDWIVMKAMEKDRTRRYETANGLAADVRRHLSHEPVTARPPSRLYEFQKSVRRHLVGFAVAALMAAVLVAATGISVWQAVRATRAQTLANERLAESEAISKFLTEVFQSPDPARDGRTITVAETLDAAAKKLETDLANQPARRAKLQATLGLTYYALGLYRKAIPLQEKVRDYYLAAAGPEGADTLGAMHHLADSYDKVERREEALKLREQVLALRRKVLGPKHPDTIKAMNNLAISYHYAGRRGEAIKLEEQVVALYSKASSPENPDTLQAMVSLGVYYYGAGRQDEARKLLERVLPLERKALGPEHPNTLMALRNLASSYGTDGRRDEARKLLEQVLALSRKVLGPEHPDTLKEMCDLAYSYHEAGRREEARQLLEEELALDRKANGPEYPGTLWAMEVLVKIYDEAGRREDAIEMQEHALAIRRKVLGLEHPDTIQAMQSLASSYEQAGRLDETLKLREQVLSLGRRALGPAYPSALMDVRDLALSFQNAGRREEAHKLLEQVLALSQKEIGPEDPDTIKDTYDLAHSCYITGRREEARKLLEEALAIDRKVNGPEYPGTLWALDYLAKIYDEAGHREEAIKMQEHALAIRRKALGPEHADTVQAMQSLASSYQQAGRQQEALKLREDLVALHRKLNGPEHRDTLEAMDNLAGCYCAVGRGSEGISLLENIDEVYPGESIVWLQLASWQLWFGQDADYEATRRRIIQRAEGTKQPWMAERAARVYCLRPSTDAALLAKALNLARRGVELGKNDGAILWYQVALGIAEYRNGQFAAAEGTLAAVEQTAGGLDYLQGTTRLFRAMSLWRQARPQEAQKVFSRAEAQMPPLPKDESKPMVVSHDNPIWWLAYKEAKALMEGSAAAAAEPPASK